MHTLSAKCRGSRSFVHMKANDRKRAYAERLYVEDGWTAKAIADTVGVSEVTIGNWGRKDGWKSKRDEMLAAPHKIKQVILQQIQLVAAGEKPTVNSDDLSKLTRALERVDQKVSVQLIITVFKEFDNWLASSDIDTEKLTAMMENHKNYIKHRIDLEG